MTGAAIPSPSIDQIERLLTSLAGVVRARVVAGPLGRPAEIHVMAEPNLHPKQVVRNIESALSAGLGVDIDRRIVSVAQVDPETPAPNGFAAHAEESESPEGSAGGDEDEIVSTRLEFVGMETTQTDTTGVTCRVTLTTEDGERMEGEGQGPATASGRSQAAAAALFAALTAALGEDAVVLEGTRVLVSNGRECVLVSAHARIGRRLLPLIGAAVVERSHEESAVLAGLQAANRFTTRADD